jgi:hypothetical protein
MNAQQIFGLQFVLSLVLYGLLARWYVAPRLAPLPLASALMPLLFLHASRFLGMVFLVPSVAGGVLPPQFAVAAAYGDLLAALLAFASIVALRARWAMAVPLVWLFNLEGTLDLINALVQGLRHQVQLGAAYYIPTVAVPALLVTHAMIFAMLLTKRA